MIFELSEIMEKKCPKIPKEYQPNPVLRAAGVVSPSCRFAHINADYEIKWLKHMCYMRKLSKRQWESLHRRIRITKSWRDRGY